jgi:hypothetical protein
LSAILIDYATRARRADPTAPAFAARDDDPAVTLHVHGRTDMTGKDPLDVAIPVAREPADWTTADVLRIIQQIATAFEMGDDVQLTWRRDRRRRKTPYGGELRLDSHQKWPFNAWARLQLPPIDLAALTPLFDHGASWSVYGEHLRLDGGNARRVDDDESTEQGGA